MSIFSNSLKRLLEESKYFEIDEWAKYLNVTPAKIQSWYQDEILPRPYSLLMIHILLEERQHSGIEALESFNKMCDQVATDVSPLGSQMLPTVRNYMKRPIFCETTSVLSKMTLEDQGLYLEAMYLGHQQNIGKKVVKDSGKPFKSGLKSNTIKGVVDHPILYIPAFTFLEDDSVVECRQCVLQSHSGEEE